MNKLTVLLSVLLVAAVAVAGYMTYQNRALAPEITADESAVLSGQITELEAKNAELSAEIVSAESRHAEQISELEAKNAELSAEIVSAESRHAEQLREDIKGLKQDMSAELSRKDGEIQELRDATTTIQLGSDVVFNLGSTRLSATGKAALSKVTELIENYPGYSVSLEGHTDNIPIKTVHQKMFPSNWELSAARASAAARFLINQGVDARRLRVVGYGLSRPIATNDSNPGRAQNRRLEIRFSPKPRIRVTE